MPSTLVIVPGSFTPSECYDPVVLPLRAKGYTVHVLDPPCYPKNYRKGVVPPSMYDDAKFINEFVAGLNEDVVIMAHSYGGVPASQCLEGISKATRSAAGRKGGVVRLAYLSAFAPKLGQNVRSAAHPRPGQIALKLNVDEDGWLYHLDPASTQAVFFNSLSLEDGKARMALVGRHSSKCFGDELTYAGYRDVPVSYFLCEDDLAMVPETQQKTINVIEASWMGTEREGMKVDVTRVKCDHFPFSSATEETMLWLEGLLR